MADCRSETLFRQLAAAAASAYSPLALIAATQDLLPAAEKLRFACLLANAQTLAAPVPKSEW